MHFTPTIHRHFSRRSHWKASIGLGFVLGLLSLSAAIADSTTPSAADIDAAKQIGTQIGQGLQGSPTIDAQGNVQKTPSGQVATGPTSSASTQGQTALMQSLTGTKGFQSAGNPGASGQTFGGTSAQSTYVDIPCSLSTGTLRGAGGVEFNFQGCQIQSGTVTAVTAQVCTTLNTGGTCQPSDYTSTLTLAANAYTSIGNLNIGVGCTDSIRVCRLTVSSTFTLSTQASQLTQQAQQQQSQNPNSTQAVLTTLVNSQEYQNQTASQQSIVDCYSQNQQDFQQSGQVSTCDGKQSVAVSGGPSGNTCIPTQTCTQPTTSTTTWTTSCTQTFPITTYSCQSTTPSLTCTTTQDGQGSVTDSTCTSAQTAGGTLVNSTGLQCTQNAPSSNDEPGPCVLYQQTDTYVFPSQATSSNCKASPLALAGPFSANICATAATDTQQTCADNGWVGRTLSDQECQVSTVDSSGAAVFTQFNYKQKAGCGYCTNETVGYTCQGASPNGQTDNSCSAASLTGCTLTSVAPQSSAYGLTTSQVSTYTCSQTTTGCAAWQTNNCVNGDASYGVGSTPVNTPGDNGAFNQVLTDGAVAEGIAKSGTANAPNQSANPTLFAGSDLRCRKPLGFVGGVINNDCCQTSLTKTGGSHVATACNQNEVTLAAARRAKFQVYIGTYCSKKTNYVFFSRCDEETQTYCVFQGILPRLVQVQGRQQLQTMASSSVGAQFQTSPLTFAFYAGNGGWTAPITVNGVQISAYQQPSYCASSQATAAAFAADPNAQACPATLDTYLAACEQPNGCGALPAVPQGGSGQWTISAVDPLTLVTSALSPHAIAQGGCDTNTQQCAYKVSAWPAGAGGRAIVSRDVSFAVYMMGNNSGGTAMAQIGNTLFKAVPVSAPASAATIGTLPATIDTQISTDGGNTWTSFSVPSQITTNITLPGTDVTITGGCTAAAGLCDYRLIGSIDITAKPWGSATQPDCSGFTLDQFSALDMGKMDLSEWVSTVTSQVNASSTSGFAAQAQQQAASGNTNTAVNPNTPQSAIVTPTEALGPFSVTLSITGNWPQMSSNATANTDPVSGVDIDWGDCSGPDTAMELPSGGFAAQHLYAAPGTPGICGMNGASSTSNPQNLVHQVVVTLHSLSGTHQVKLQVKNDYTDYSSP